MHVCRPTKSQVRNNETETNSNHERGTRKEKRDHKDTLACFPEKQQAMHSNIPPGYRKQLNTS